MQITRNRTALTTALIGAIMLTGAGIGAASMADATPVAPGELRKHCDWEACATYRCVDGACKVEAPFRY